MSGDHQQNPWSKNDYGGLSQKEIALLLGITRQAVAYHEKRAMKKLLSAALEAKKAGLLETSTALSEPRPVAPKTR